MKSLISRCTSCKVLGTELYRCACGGSIALEHKRFARVTWSTFRGRPFNHWRYKEFYILPKHSVSLNEGGTSLLQSVTTPGLSFKIEGDNPTGSFKDRGSTIEVSMAKSLGAKHVVLASTGNMGASTAAYAARAGLDCTVIVPKDTTHEKLVEMQNFGAKIVKIRGDYTAAAKQAWAEYVRGKFLCGDYALRREGEKSIAFEVMEQAPLADYIVAPVGNGTLISGIWQGLCDLKSIGLIRRSPRLVGVQASGCDPLYHAFRAKHRIHPVSPNTIASAIACGAPLDGDLAYKALTDSHGLAVSVTDKELIQARRELAKKEGIDVEPSGAASFAGLKKLNLSKHTNVVCVASGHGLKDLKNC